MYLFGNKIFSSFRLSSLGNEIASPYKIKLVDVDLKMQFSISYKLISYPPILKNEFFKNLYHS